MTSCVLSVCLLFTPPAAPKEAPQWTITNAGLVSVASAEISTTPLWSETFPVTWPVETLMAATDEPTPLLNDSALSLPPSTPPPPSTLRERALNRFAELGAPQWVVNGFDCVGWSESKWSNVRSRTGDTGVLQINDIHRPELARLGLDPWSPEDSASFSWLLFTRAGWSFRDWTVRGLCGLR